MANRAVTANCWNCWTVGHAMNDFRPESERTLRSEGAQRNSGLLHRAARHTYLYYLIKYPFHHARREIRALTVGVQQFQQLGDLGKRKPARKAILCQHDSEVVP